MILKPPFNKQTAIEKVRFAEDAWNSCDPDRVILGYAADCRWRNRSEIFQGHTKILDFLRRKWAKELDYRLVKELWLSGNNLMAVRFAYEWQDDAGNWYRSYGNENWEFKDDGLIKRRIASINDLRISESERKFHWPRNLPRPSGHPSLSDLSL